MRVHARRAVHASPGRGTGLRQISRRRGIPRTGGWPLPDSRHAEPPADWHGPCLTESVTLTDGIGLVLDRLRPALHADGGDIELVAVDGDVVRLRLIGACAGCPTASMTLQVGVEGALRRLRPALRVEAVG